MTADRTAQIRAALEHLRNEMLAVAAEWRKLLAAFGA
jgi:hypothetical protein